jgi:hypothetical protein
MRIACPTWRGRRALPSRELTRPRGETTIILPDLTNRGLSARSFSYCPHHFQPSICRYEQQNKMSACNKEAADKKGEERKAFTKECLSNKPATSAKQPTAAQKVQQDKMNACNADAKGMKGDERKKFMSGCLKKG